MSEPTWSSVLNPCEQFVENLRARIKDNNSWCLYAENKNDKRNKCPKACKRNAQLCMCGMYIKEQEQDE